MIKVYYFISLVWAIFFLPWWLFCLALLVAIFIFDWYWPAVVAAFIFDAVYGLPSTGWLRTQFVVAVAVLLGLALVDICKRRLIYYRY